jgi:non-canonical purine NTP pyrophosphatase (RdgB/HAM1 family)
MEIIFSTSNKGKLATARRHLEELGITVTAQDLDIVEPQLDSVREIAVAKAKSAYKSLGKPVMVQDTGFEIEALDGFPGPYAKYVQEKLGVEGFMRLMNGVENRNCCFVGVIAYADQNGEIHVFEERGPKGVIADVADTLPLRPDAWSLLWQIYVPEGSDKTLNSMNDIEREDWYQNHRGPSVFIEFAQWIASKSQKSTPKPAQRKFR